MEFPPPHFLLLHPPAPIYLTTEEQPRSQGSAAQEEEMDTMIPWPHHEDGIGLIKYRQQQLPQPIMPAVVPPPQPPAAAAPARKARLQKDKALHCPRCNSNNTKFCYYNNYSLTQPRYFCKTCRRYWTEGGTLRNVPVGGGSRKNKKHSSSSSASTSGAPRASLLQQQPLRQTAVRNPRILGGHLGCSGMPTWPLISSPLEPSQEAIGGAGDVFTPPSGCYDYAQPGVFSFQDMMICSSKMPGGDQRGDLAHGGIWN